MLAVASTPFSGGFGPRRARCSLQGVERSPETAAGGNPGAAGGFPPIPRAKRVVLVRHGQSTWNEEGRIQGSSDHSVLTPKGESQAETSRQMLLSDAFDVCFTRLIGSPPSSSSSFPTVTNGGFQLYPLRVESCVEKIVFSGIIGIKGPSLSPSISSGWLPISSGCGRRRCNFAAVDDFVPLCPVNRFMLSMTGTQHSCAFCSPLARSKRTAEIIWGSRGAEMIPDSDLREIDLYSFQGLLKHEGKAKFGDAYRQWQLDAPNFIIDGHYPVRELWARARSCWDRILAHNGKSVLVVAHNAVNQALVATALGLNTRYFRFLLQSNCGVSVLDFTPNPRGGSPLICLNRLNQTPNSPIARGSSGGRKAAGRIFLVCYGTTQSGSEVTFASFGYESMNMLGVIQSQKTAEVLLDVKVNSIVCSPRIASVDTATAIAEVQEAADCLGADCVPRYVEMKNMLELEVEELWDQSGRAWELVLKELAAESEPERNVVAVGHPALHVALIGHCLGLTEAMMGSFHLDSGSISVIDFPDGPRGRGVVRCVNYTAHLGRWSIPVTRPTATNDEEF
ncbi:unnamed protein product [Spirodela intermedia]|uniref:Uncharacterized protein n=1 Tax=Spirodela intermedia TaxID=51605 RepID=A0A7I8KIJ4_SPIIN|nr:unnamed protein product [Spirodela intermedia]